MLFFQSLGARFLINKQKTRCSIESKWAQNTGSFKEGAQAFFIEKPELNITCWHDKNENNVDIYIRVTLSFYHWLRATSLNGQRVGYSLFLAPGFGSQATFGLPYTVLVRVVCTRWTFKERNSIQGRNNIVPPLHSYGLNEYTLCRVLHICLANCFILFGVVFFFFKGNMLHLIYICNLISAFSAWTIQQLHFYFSNPISYVIAIMEVTTSFIIIYFLDWLIKM